MLKALCSGLPGSRQPLTGAEVPRSSRWYQNSLAAAAVRNRLRCCQPEICPALACGAHAWVAWALVAVGRPVPVAVAADSGLAPVAALVVQVCFDPAYGFAGNCHRAVECSDYTCASPGERKIDPLRSQNRSCDLCHSGGPHGIFQLMDPLAA